MQFDKRALIFMTLALVLIPSVHLLAPLFYASTPNYVATEGGSIIGQGHNIYLQLLPYVVAYISAPILFILGLLRQIKQWKKTKKAHHSQDF